MLTGAFAFAQFRIQNKFIADIQQNFIVFKGGHTDFRPLEITQDSHLHAEAGSDFTNFIRTFNVIVRAAVRKVHTNHIGTGTDDFFKVVIAIGGGAQGRYDFRSSEAY